MEDWQKRNAIEEVLKDVITDRGELTKAAFHIVKQFEVIPKGSIVIYEGEEWAAVYENGDLAEEAGDAYHADEWLRDRVGVTTIQNEDFFRGGRDRDSVARTLDQIQAWREKVLQEQLVAEEQEKDAKIATLEAELAALRGN